VEFWNSKHSKLVTFKEKEPPRRHQDSWLVQKAFGFRRSPKPTLSARCVLRLLRSLARSPLRSPSPRMLLARCFLLHAHRTLLPPRFASPAPFRACSSLAFAARPRWLPRFCGPEATRVRYCICPSPPPTPIVAARVSADFRRHVRGLSVSSPPPPRLLRSAFLRIPERPALRGSQTFA
jgi:hypothetical protein